MAMSDSASGSSKAWGGRYQAETSPDVEAYTGSLPFDRRLYRQDIAGSQAHARMLGHQGILTSDEADTIVAALDSILGEIEAGDFSWRAELEDIHMNVEARLIALTGPLGGKLHTARSRNDQVALDMHLYLRDQIDELDAELVALQRALLRLAQDNRESIMPGYTHLQRAQPVSLAHHLLAYFFMFQRDRERLADARARVDMSPLGAGALAGTTFPLDPDQVAQDLGFTRRYANSMDAVSDRDFVLETLSACSIVAVHLSRLGEELVIWSSAEFGFVQMSDSYTTGSSIMPQKKNPVVAELLRGKCGRVVGALTGALVMLKGLPLAYNTDMQEDKEGTFDALDTVRQSVQIAVGALETTTFNQQRMRAAAISDYLNATDMADYLTAKGIPFRDAHRLAAAAVNLAVERRLTLDQLPLADLRAISDLFEGDVYAHLTPEAGINRESPMGTGLSQVETQIELAQQLLSRAPGEILWVDTGLQR